MLWANLLSLATVQMRRKKLANILRDADDAGFCQLVWAVDAMQSGREDAVEGLLEYPPEAVATQIGQQNFLFKWSLETLVNELLVTPKAPAHVARRRTLNTKYFGSLGLAYTALHKLEDSESAIFLRSHSVFEELPMIGHRQFDWQRGFYNMMNFYRSTYIYHGPEAADYFTQKYQITPANFVLSGLAAWLSLQSHPSFTLPVNLPEVGLVAADFERSLALLCRPLDQARSITADIRRTSGSRAAYRRSILRDHPCFSRNGGQQILAPLPELIILRITTGLFYDMVKAGPGAVSLETSQRFETYCQELLSVTFPEITCQPEQTYQLNGQERKTPDILMSDAQGCFLVAECKARRMSMKARYSEDPMSAEPGAFKELSKGICQIWRYFSHVRRGMIAGHVVKADALGLVLTLDPWLRMSPGRYEAILKTAVELADAEGNITAEDRKPVAFGAVEDLESLLVRCDLTSLLATVRKATIPEFARWHLADLHRNHFKPDPPIVRPYPFGDRLGDLLPWWNLIQELAPADA